MSARRLIAAASFALLLAPSAAAKPAARRAVLVGINDYSASTLSDSRAAGVSDRGWSNLDGAVNDVLLMREILMAKYEFAARDIVMLTDQQATRSAILGAIDKHLGRNAARGDVLLFYYSGHGSQVPNSRSTEADKLDESLVPADSRRGAPDIRDKELGVAFNRILDRGARLTIVLDACHSGSGARGLIGGLRHRGVTADPRDAADARNVMKPEDRGALVLSAAEDFDLAHETLADRTIRGAFSWALARSLRDAAPGEPASDTFLRAEARLRVDRPAQNPVLAGVAHVRHAPFLAATAARHKPPQRIAIQNVQRDGTITLLGGWVHGLTVGTRLSTPDRPDLDLEVTSLIGAGRATARVLVHRNQRSRNSTALEPGSLLDVTSWAAPPLRNLRIWIPHGPDDAIATARTIAASAAARGAVCIDDPTDITPAALSRWRGGAWETLSLAQHPSTLFVQVPATTIAAAAAEGVEGIELLDGPENAEYVLTGRLSARGVEYAWVRPGVIAADAARSPMPARSAWTLVDEEDDVLTLRSALVRLVRIQGWHELRSPTGNVSHYRLAVRDARDGRMIEDSLLVGRRKYRLVLRLRDTNPGAPIRPRYVYVFAIDNSGKGVLLFPRLERGSVENLLPWTETPARAIEQPPAEIPLSEGPTFVVSPPYGIDSYFLLTTDSPLSSVSFLDWEGVRAPSFTPRSPLEALLGRASGIRGPESVQTSPYWSIEATVFQSVPPEKGSL